MTAPRADVDELGRLLAAATPGPWEAQGGMVVSDPGPCAKYVADCYDEPKVSAADAALIAQAHNALPALLAEVSELRATVARVEALRDAAVWRSEHSLSRTFTGEPFPALVSADEVTAALDGAS